MRSSYPLILLSCCLAGQVWAVELESPVDVRFVSQLRVELRSVQEPDRCQLLWKGIEEKLADKNSLDVVVLARLSQFLKTKMAYKLLAEFVDNCVDALSVKYKTPVVVPAKDETVVDINDDVGLLLQDIDALRSEVAEKERQLEFEKANHELLPVKVEQLTREKDEALKEVNDLRLKLEAAEKSACNSDASEAKLKEAIRDLHRTSQTVIQQIKNEPQVKGYEAMLASNQVQNQVHKEELPSTRVESIPNPYATAAAATVPYNWPAPMLPSSRQNMGLWNNRAPIMSAFASATV